MKTCKNCGHFMEDKQLYCEKCGELNEVKFEFRLSNTNMIIGVVACIVDIILLISIIIAFVYLRGLKK